MRTRIIATVGPACAHTSTLRRMIREGVSVFRLNFSHGSMEDHERFLARIQRAQHAESRHVAILQDLAGHRIRTGLLRGGREIQLTRGQRFSLYREPAHGTHRGVSLDYPGAFSDIHPRQMIYVADGTIHLKVLRSTEHRLETIVTQEGALGERKGVNVPGAQLDFPPASTKDIQDLEFAIHHKIQYVAQSFVRSAADVYAVKRRLAVPLPHGIVIAKIENREGVLNLAAILRAAGGLMVARGDLGISVPIHEIPILQKWMIAACNHFKKPVITATQMLEHMIDHREPTRAEVTDVANAVIDGSDFVMLSGETATGRYPIEAVSMMRRIIEYTERHAPFRGVRRTR
ncbi:MAG: pyruvate kinase [Candidatus Omnitrophica bacterium]|nr:pyruvate kinase [Candidatus Omnitrophota bacterium]